MLTRHCVAFVCATNTHRKDGKEEKKSLEEEVNLWTPYIPEKPSRILCGFHAKEEGRFWLSMVSIFTVVIAVILVIRSGQSNLTKGCQCPPHIVHPNWHLGAKISTFCDNMRWYGVLATFWCCCENQLQTFGLSASIRYMYRHLSFIRESTGKNNGLSFASGSVA